MRGEEERGGGSATAREPYKHAEQPQGGGAENWLCLC